MGLIRIISVLTMLVVSGYASGSEATIVELDAVDTTASTATVDTITGIPGPRSILAAFSGATFVAVEADQLNGGSASGVGSVRFTNNAVSWTQSKIVTVNSFVRSQSVVVEVGSYENDGSAELVASFPDRDITFASDGGNLTWNSLSYRRAVGSQFNSQDGLEAYLDGSTFNTIEQFTITGGQSIDQAMTSWSVRFDGEDVFWAERGGTALVGTFSFVDDSSFKMNFSNREVTVVALDRDELVIDAVIYEKDQTNQYDSQTSLIDFLDNASFRSNSLQNVGDSGLGTSAIGYWLVDFSGDTFTWSYRGIEESGTVSFKDNNRFTAVLSNRELIIEVEGDDFLWDGVRYRKVIGE